MGRYQVMYQVRYQVAVRVQDLVNRPVHCLVRYLAMVQVLILVQDQVHHQAIAQVQNQVAVQIHYLALYRVKYQVKYQVTNQVLYQVIYQVMDPVIYQVMFRVMYQVRCQVMDQVRNQLRYQVMYRVTNQVTNQVMYQLAGRTWRDTTRHQRKIPAAPKLTCMWRKPKQHAWLIWSALVLPNRATYARETIAPIFPKTPTGHSTTSGQHTTFGRTDWTTAPMRALVWLHPLLELAVGVKSAIIFAQIQLSAVRNMDGVVRAQYGVMELIPLRSTLRIQLLPLHKSAFRVVL